mgnify:CR=1 FL=1
MGINFIIGRKVGMTRIFDNQGMDYPVTVVEAGPCNVVQLKSFDKEGYSSVQIGFDEKLDSKLIKSEKGHFNNANISGRKVVKEFRFDGKVDNIKLGDEITASIFDIGDRVVVKGISKGKGFAGHMKRHNFGGGRASHGKNSVMRKAGSVGAGTSPGKVWKGTRMAGRMGGEFVSVKNLLVTRIDGDKNLIFIRGAIPGANNGIVYISRQ